MDTKRQTATIERQTGRKLSRMDKRAQAKLADYAYQRLVRRFEQTGEC